MKLQIHEAKKRLVTILNVTIVFLSLAYSSPIFMVIPLYVLVRKNKATLEHISVFFLSLGLLTLVSKNFSLPSNSQIDILKVLLSAWIAFIIGKKWSVEKVSFTKSRNLLPDLVFLGGSILVGVNFLRGPNYLFNTILNIGYDHVGHFAMLFKNSDCLKFLTECDSESTAVPTSYLTYPQQWHLIFSNFVESESFTSNFFQYLIVLIFSLAISIHISAVAVSRILHETPLWNQSFRNSKSVMFYTQSTIGILFIILLFMGYPNFVFSLALFLLGFDLLSKSKLTDKVAGSLILVFCVSTYTLFLIPAAAISSVFFFVRRDFKLEIAGFFNLIFWIALVLKVVRDANANTQYEYISFGGGPPSLLVFMLEISQLIILIYSIRSTYVELKSVRKSIFNLMILANLITLFSLVGIHTIVLLSGEENSYYLTKFGYLNSILMVITLAPLINAKVREFSFSQLKSTSALNLLALNLVWFGAPYAAIVISYFPFRSPIVPIYSAAKTMTAETSERASSILSSALIGKQRERPVVLISNQSGPDTQWVNAISGNWSQDLNSILESGDLEVMVRNEANKLLIERNQMIVIRGDSNDR